MEEKMKTLELTRADLKEQFQKLDLLDIEFDHVDWENVVLNEKFDEFVLIDGNEFWEQKRLIEDYEY